MIIFYILLIIDTLLPTFFCIFFKNIMKSQRGLQIHLKGVKEIKQSFEPHKQVIDEMVNDINKAVDGLYSTVDRYNHLIDNSASQSVKNVLRSQYKFSSQSHQDKHQLKNTMSSTAYLHQPTLYRKRMQAQSQTKIDLMQKALGEDTLARAQRKVATPQDTAKVKQVIKKIQTRMDEDEMIREREEEETRRKVQRKEENDLMIGQLTLDMIADLRKKYFSELTSKNVDEKYKKIQHLKDVYIPQQIERVKQQYSINQKLQLKQEMLSKRSQFNSYYGLLALEKTMQKLVKLKLKGEITSYSRFKGVTSADSYQNVNSPVRTYIKQNTLEHI